jgi:cupin fold WbuC family metalloprotein
MNLKEWRQDEKAKSITYFSIKRPVCVSKELIGMLKRISEENENKNARLCLHASPDDSLHDMIILEYQNKKCRKPHKHLEKEETLHMIEGKMVSLIFDEKGTLVDKTCLDENNLAYRTSRNQYHVWLPLTNHVIYREIKQGPFKQEDNISPRFDYIDALKRCVDFMDLTCSNPNCKNPCALSKIK